MARVFGTAYSNKGTVFGHGPGVAGFGYPAREAYFRQKEADEVLLARRVRRIKAKETRNRNLRMHLQARLWLDAWREKTGRPAVPMPPRLQKLQDFLQIARPVL